jgi:hypothetical protein
VYKILPVVNKYDTMRVISLLFQSYVLVPLCVDGQAPQDSNNTIYVCEEVE